MLEAFKYFKNDNAETADSVTLTYEERKKSRHRTKTKAGKELGWFIERGHVLEDREVLECTDGTLIRVIAAEESVSEVTSDDARALMRAAYHLGNRHMPLQVGEGFLRYQHDHVLDEMVVGLGLKVDHAHAPFHPENGAYSHSAENGSHEHSHSYTSPDGRHSHSHSHSHTSHSSSSASSSSHTVK